ncbi:MAG: hypothetical protein V5A84_01980 [Planctomycetota bacterium]
MSRKSLFVVVALCVLCLQVSALGASGEWSPAGREEFSGGTLQDTSISPRGSLQLAPPVEQIPGMQANLVWDLAAADDGTLYAGTGGPAAVWALQDGEMQRIHRSSRKHIMSLLPLPGGDVLAAGTPGGVIYEITPGGKASIRAELDEEYVWDMARGPQGAVWCATGPEGRLVRVSSDGTVETVLDTEQKHLMSLAAADGDALYVGTAPDGLVLRVRADGTARILYDAPEEEVHDLLTDDEGTLYASTAATKPSPGGGGGQSNADSSPMKPGNGAAEKVKGTPPASNSIYRIDPDAGAARVAQVEKALLLSMAFDADGHLLAGTGMNGRLLRVAEGQNTGIVTQFEAAQVSAMVRGPDGSVYAATSSGGGMWRLGTGCVEKGTFLSAPYDADYLSRWGRVSWDGDAPGETSVKVRLRTGNSKQPDSYWSEWSAPVTMAGGEAVEVPAGRFAQLKVELASPESGATPRVWKLTASYRQTNRRPSIEEAKLDGNNGSPAPNPTSSQGDNKQNSTLKLQWKASDPNEDELTYDLFFKSVGAARWKTLAEDLDEQKYEWNTDRVPAGQYLLRLVASDRPDRAEEEALTAEHVFRPLMVDNRRPDVLDLKAEAAGDGTYRITGQAEDSHSSVKSIRVSRNSGDWKPVFPADGIMDGSRERFSYRTEELSDGEHVFVFSAKDEKGNVGSSRIVIDVAD